MGRDVVAQTQTLHIPGVSLPVHIKEQRAQDEDEIARTDVPKS